jgi:hypothetical protein
MTDAAMDIWLDSAQYDGETLATLRENLVQAFNLSVSQAAVLINGNSHRIKRSCTIEEAEKLVQQFGAWGIDLRVEVIPTGEVGSLNASALGKKETGQISTSATFSLAPQGETIPNLLHDKTPPNVMTDHLHLRDE